MIRSNGVWLAALAALGCAAPSWALVSSRVAVELPQIALVDLEPGDGIPARWMSGGYSPPVFHFELHPAPVADEVYGDGQLDNQLATAIGGSATAPRSGYFGVTDLYMPGFTVTATPYTRVTVTVPFSLQTVIDGLSIQGTPLPGVLSSVELSLVAVNNVRPGPDGTVLYDDLSYERDSAVLETRNGSTERGARQREGDLQVSFDNASASDAVFAFRAELVTFGDTGSVAAVPEPGSQALWILGGAALLGASRRRRG